MDPDKVFHTLQLLADNGATDGLTEILLDSRWTVDVITAGEGDVTPVLAAVWQVRDLADPGHPHPSVSRWRRRLTSCGDSIVLFKSECCDSGPRLLVQSSMGLLEFLEGHAPAPRFDTF